MSTIVISNIKATGETASRAVSGVAAAWANLNGTGTIALRDSVNIASVTDNAVGTYTFNFSNNMANTSYSTVSASRNRATGSNNSYTATSSKRIELWEPSSSPALSDTDEVTASIHGDLA